jgi:ATP-dependent Lon protease
VGSYTEDEKVEIAVRHLIPKQIEEHGLKPSNMEWKSDAVRLLARSYVREAGVRNLERQIGTVTRKVTLKFAEGRTAKFTITKKKIGELLGAPKYLQDLVEERKPRIGTAVGLAWTPAGGDVLFIETTLMPSSKGGMIATGQLGDVMRESITAATSYIRTNAKTLRVDPAVLESNEIHVHVPAGAVPKDGPSAGVTMLTAMASLLSSRMIKPRLAMTGELTLGGDVLPVGGIKEKGLAAQRAGVRTVLMPEQNKKDYMEDVPEDIRNMLEVHFVNRAEQVLKLALERA